MGRSKRRAGLEQGLLGGGVTDPRFELSWQGSPGRRSTDFVAVEGIPVHSTAPPFARRRRRGILGGAARARALARARAFVVPATRPPGAPRDGSRASLCP